MTTQLQNTQALIEKIQSLPIDRIEQLENFIDFLKSRTEKKIVTHQQTTDFPVISVGVWPNDLSLHRENMYGDDDR